ncbi:uncharacterized protein [Notamacropus eugenii]|uniref:uncharacterized protein isoform X3 n=1 Tax=Notamacropus eugenii TaxID=9315 RepID=UPI003B683F6D
MESEGSRDLIFPPLTEPGDAPLPNLTPRHQELIPTPCGPIKPWSELSCPVKVYFCITLVSLVSIIGLTIKTLVQKSDENFTVSLIQLIGVVFCIYYVTRGILQENRQELIVFILSILLVMLRSLVNFLVLMAEEKPAREDPVILARFVVILSVGFFDVICAIILIRTQGMMAFRVGGALESLQAQYFMLNLCFSMLTFDLQAQLCLCVLILTSGLYASLQHSLMLIIGVLWAILKVTIGILAILRELKALVWIFLIQNIPEVAYLFYLLYTISRAWGQGSSYTGEAAAIVGSCISVVIKSVLLWAMVHVYRSFGQGLRERTFQKSYLLPAPSSESRVSGCLSGRGLSQHAHPQILQILWIQGQGRICFLPMEGLSPEQPHRACKRPQGLQGWDQDGADAPPPTSVAHSRHPCLDDHSSAWSPAPHPPCMWQ